MSQVTKKHNRFDTAERSVATKPAKQEHRALPPVTKKKNHP